ncbi:MAG: response regulator [Desulfobacca sp.]|uniref:response regulator n=1 Tax=Desulfobacca sp. TaxID=2067990 RepID=UPI00404B9C51
MPRILVVDDDTSLRVYLQEELQDMGYDVLTASSAPEALKIIEKEPVDLVILDIRMPGMTGIEALPRILGLKENLPIILNTAYSQYKDDFMAWAANAYVVKSFDLTELKEKIQELLPEKPTAEPPT